MISPAKIQTAAFDVAEWEVDSEFGIFPQGARAKEAVFAPDPPPESVIIPNRRYLFKRSRERYPDQFWAEIVAYRVGCLMGVEVPPAFAAWNSRTGISAALIEWFYVDGNESFIWGGDLLMKLRPGFDRKTGAQHNLKDNTVLMRAFAKTKAFHTNWRQWWVDALLFDALIGNWDRHQDNWGLIFGPTGIRLSPLFDNGTALGHDRVCAKFRGWHDRDVDGYIERGRHHLKWSLDQQGQLLGGIGEAPIGIGNPKWAMNGKEPPNGHLNLLRRALAEWPETCQTASQRLSFSATDLSEALSDLTTLDVPMRLSPERWAFMLRLLKRRYELLKLLFE